MTLRDYQQECVDVAIEWIKSRKDSAILDLATGAGKSHVIAALAEWFNQRTGKKVLCLAPSKELVAQNHAKFISTGTPASIFCASINKSLAHNIVFGSPQTVLNSIDKFDDEFCLVIIDEAHNISPTIKNIVGEISRKQKHLRVIGLTATPYRMGDGYIYQYGQDGSPVEAARDPYFHQMIYRVPAQNLIDRGFLTPPTTGQTHAEKYDTSELQINSLGQFSADTVERAFEGRGRITAAIVADIVEMSRGRRGVIIFAATVHHAHEVLESLPPELSAIVHGGTKKKDRESIIEKFKQKRIKYLVNVAVLTTGFDAPHIDVVAFMRATESASLMQQMIGRGLRLDEGKADCLVLDYAGNIERHCPDGDLFNPEIKVSFKGESEPAQIECPACASINLFGLRKNPDKFEIDKNGYFIDLAGNRIVDPDTQKEYPAHYGRRCFGQIITGKIASRCEYRWSSKDCPECGHHNDIAARYCESCKTELIDPNEKLRIDFKRMKSDPYTVSTDKVLSWRVQERQSKAGNTTLRIDYTTDYADFAIWYTPDSKMQKARFLWADLCIACVNRPVKTVAEFVDLVNSFEAERPKTITARKDRDSKFYEAYGHNRPEDIPPP